MVISVSFSVKFTIFIAFFIVFIFKSGGSNTETQIHGRSAQTVQNFFETQDIEDYESPIFLGSNSRFNQSSKGRIDQKKENDDDKQAYSWPSTGRTTRHQLAFVLLLVLVVARQEAFTRNLDLEVFVSYGRRDKAETLKDMVANQKDYSELRDFATGFLSLYCRCEVESGEKGIFVGSWCCTNSFFPLFLSIYLRFWREELGRYLNVTSLL